MASEPSRALNVVCDRVSWDFVPESYFIREVLLGGLRRPVRVLPLEENETLPLMNDLLVICHENRMRSFIGQAVQRGIRNLGVFHMGDEQFAIDRAFYAEVDYVIRNYFDRAVLTVPASSRCMGILWVPNGYRYGIGMRSTGTLAPFSARSNLLFFAGQCHGGKQPMRDREKMIEVMTRHHLPGILVTTPGFAAGLAAGSYGALMENSRFALVPRGLAEETIRLYDALELGAIPVSLRHNFLVDPAAMAGAPVVTLDDWERLPEWVAQHATATTQQQFWEERQRALIDWWSAFKARKQAEVAALIERSFSRAAA